MNHVQAFHLGTDCTLAISCILTFTSERDVLTRESLEAASQAVIAAHPVAGCKVSNGSSGQYLQPHAVPQWSGTSLPVADGDIAQWCDHVAWAESCHGVDAQQALARFVVSEPVRRLGQTATVEQVQIGLVLLVHHVATDARGLAQLLRDLVLAALRNRAAADKAAGAAPPAAHASGHSTDAPVLEDWMLRLTAALESRPPAAASSLRTRLSFPKVLPACLPVPRAKYAASPAEPSGAAAAATSSTPQTASMSAALPPAAAPPCFGSDVADSWSKAVRGAAERQSGAVPAPHTAPWECDSPPVVHTGTGLFQPAKPSHVQFTSRLRLDSRSTSHVLAAAKRHGVGVWAWLQAASLLVEASFAAPLARQGSAAAAPVWPVRALTFVDARSLVEPPLPPSFVGPVTGVASLDTMSVTPSSSVPDLAEELQGGLRGAVESLDVLRTVQTLLFGGTASLAVNNYGALTQLELPAACGAVMSDVWVVRQERTAPAAHEQFNLVVFSLQRQLHLSVSFMPAVWHGRCVGLFLRRVAQVAVDAALDEAEP